MHARQGQADDEAAERAVFRLLGGHAQNIDDENERQDDFHQKARHGAAADAAQTVGTEAAGHIGHTAHAEHRRQDRRAHERAHTLGNHVVHELHDFHAAGEQDPQRHSGVDVASGDVADGIGHGHNGQAERQGREDVASAVGGVTAHQHGSAAA